MAILYTSYVSVCNGNIKCPVGNSIFAENLPFKLFRATVANADIESLKSVRTLFDTYLNHKLAKFELNRFARNVQNFELFDTDANVERNIETRGGKGKFYSETKSLGF